MAAGAKSAEYSCRVPRALLCPGCASQIVVSLQSGGGCRISFTPETPSASNASAEQLEFRVEAPPVVVTRIAPRGALAWRARRVAVTKPAPSRRCFVFNGQEYCE
jgi:hypothetical protein